VAKKGGKKDKPETDAENLASEGQLESDTPQPSQKERILALISTYRRVIPDRFAEELEKILEEE